MGYTTVKTEWGMYLGLAETTSGSGSQISPETLKYMGFNNKVPLKLWSASAIASLSTISTINLAGDSNGLFSSNMLFQILGGTDTQKYGIFCARVGNGRGFQYGIIWYDSNYDSTTWQGAYPYMPMWTGSSSSAYNASNIQDALNQYPDYGIMVTTSWEISRYSLPLVWISLVNPNTLTEMKKLSGSDSFSSRASIYNIFELTEENPDEPDDPYGDSNSGPGGGGGILSGESVDIGIPSLPTLSAVNTGFITLFNPSLSQLQSLAIYMWSDLFDLAGWKKNFADPMDAILGLSIVPVAVPDGGTTDVIVGNMSTGVLMNRAATQYVEVDCGTINIQEYWGAYLDYDPYTKVDLYLPYIGTHPLAVDDVMNKNVRVVYHVDILSGACCAFVQCGGTVLYTFNGQCSSSIPITGDNWTNTINGVLSIAGSIGSMVATGGATAPMAALDIASTAVNSFKPSIEKSGAMGGTGGMLAVQVPYLIVTRPRLAKPARQKSFTGYPSFITNTLGDLSGYTEIENIHIENVPATDQELAEIETLLKGGVIL